MPELPEVETVRRSLAPRLEGRRILGLEVRQPDLRWPVPRGLGRRLQGRKLRRVGRRGKWLLLELREGAALIHLGMSGSLRLVSGRQAPARHDHLELRLQGGRCLRFHDPRRFGALLWADGDPLEHPLLARLGPEPLEPGFDGEGLHARSRGRRIAVKNFLMDGAVVAGLGNIYAAEALYAAGIHPLRAAGRISLGRYRLLAGAIRSVLLASIRAGGTSLRDFVDGDGASGWYRLELRVYGRAGRPCSHCGAQLRDRRVAGRGTVYCPRCQR